MKKLIIVLLLSAIPCLAQKAEKSLPKDVKPIDQVADTYKFGWEYQFKGEFGTELYRLQPGASYFATEDKWAFKIFHKNRMVALTNKPDNTGSVLPHGFAGAAINREPYKLTKAVGKVIMGYDCIGVTAENNKEILTVYFTNKAPVALPKLNEILFRLLVQPLSAYGYGDKSLVLQIDMVEKSTKPENAQLKPQPESRTTLSCVSLKPSPFVFKKSDYKWREE